MFRASLRGWSRAALISGSACVFTLNNRHVAFTEGVADDELEQLMAKIKKLESENELLRKRAKDTLLEEVHSENKNKNKKPGDKKKSYLGIDLGGTTVTVAVVDDSGAVAAEVSRPLPDRSCFSCVHPSMELNVRPA